MTTRADLLTSIANTIQDYRVGEIAKPTPEHVERWVGQFDAAVQEPILSELDYVLKRTYLDRAKVTTFLIDLLTNANLVGNDPCAFWRGVTFLNIQGGGNSQREMLIIFDALLRRQCGFGIADCGANGNAFVYLDDAIFTGNRVLNDIKAWLQSSAPTNTTVYIITIGLHRGGWNYAQANMTTAAVAANKTINLSCWRIIELEDRRHFENTSDVLRPRTLGNEPLITAYAQSLRFWPTLRSQDSVGDHQIFSSEHGRNILEQEFLKAGVHIRDMCPYLGKYQRPLGNMILETLGFGSTIVTFRNCPNNAPLALWAGYPWYPLFERKTN